MNRVMLVVFLFACGDDSLPSTRTDAGRDAAQDAARDAARDTGVDAPFDSSPDVFDANLVCDDGFDIDPIRFVVRFTHPTIGLTNIVLDVTGPGMPMDVFEALESDSPPYRWRWRVAGATPGVHELVVRADPDDTEYGRCQVAFTGGDAGTPMVDAGPCSCADKLCGEDDGCGTPCQGAHRAERGGVNDCRLEGNCGCGIEPNDNMECTGDGRCRIRCSCDCLAPQLRDAVDLIGLDHPGACALVFRESGDPTVWDAETDTALCPLDHDPEGAARCTECPPCHRDHPPSCGWDAWCTCRDPRWIDEYRTMCCAAGAEYCF